MYLKETAKNLVADSLMLSERLVRHTRTWPVPEQIRTLLVLEYMLPLGCCVHLTPLYEAVKSARPGITLAVATRGLGAAVLRHNPAVDHVIETPDPLTDTFAAARSLRASLRERSLHPDCVFTGASDQRTRIAILAALTGAPRGGFTLTPRLYQRPLRYRQDRSLIANNLQVAALLDIEPHRVEPRVYCSPSDAVAAKRLVNRADAEGKPLAVFVTQNSGGQRTGWHVERFVQVIRHAQTLGCAIAYVGIAADGAAIEHLRQTAGSIGTSFAGQTSVTELAALLALSDIVVSLDTGTMHVARAVGVPMVVIGPSWQRPIEWLPVGLPQVRILRGEDRDDIPEGYQLDEVQASDVIAAVEDLLRTYPPDPKARASRLQSILSTVDHSGKT